MGQVGGGRGLCGVRQEAAPSLFLPACPLVKAEGPAQRLAVWPLLSLSCGPVPGPFLVIFCSSVSRGCAADSSPFAPLAGFLRSFLACVLRLMGASTAAGLCSLCFACFIWRGFLLSSDPVGQEGSSSPPGPNRAGFC